MIVHLVNRLEIGGVEVGVMSLLESEYSSDYIVIAIKGADYDFISNFSARNRSNIYICNGYFNAFLKIINLKPRFLVSSLWRGHFIATIYKLFYRETIKIHFAHSARFAHFLDKIFTKVSIYLSDYIFSDSDKTNNWLQSNVKIKSPQFIIPMNISFIDLNKGIDVMLSKERIDFVFFGRFCKEKNISFSLYFIKKLVDSGVNLKFDLFGRDDGELPMLQELSKSLNLDSYVSFKGCIPPNLVEKTMINYDIYLQTSIVEGMSISVFQAEKIGLLPVVTPVGEIPNYTVDNYNAIYLNEDIDEGVSKFLEALSSGFLGYRTGIINNMDNYPTFSNKFFSVMDDINGKN